MTENKGKITTNSLSNNNNLAYDERAHAFNQSRLYGSNPIAQINSNNNALSNSNYFQNPNSNAYLTEQIFQHLNNNTTPNFPQPNVGLNHLPAHNMDIDYDFNKENYNINTDTDYDKVIENFVEKASKKQCIKALEKIVKNVRYMHAQVSTEEKSTVLGLVAMGLSRRQLDELGFKFTSNQYQKACEKQKEKRLNFEPKEKPLRNSKKKQAIDQRIEQILILNSERAGNETIKLSDGNFHPVYRLKCSRRDIYDVLRTQGIKMSISNFYKRIPDNFRPHSAK